MITNHWVAGLLACASLARFGGVLLAQETSRPAAPPPAPTRRPNFRPIPGEAIGIIHVEAGPLLAAEGRSAPPGAAVFARDGASPRLFYVAVTGGSGGKTLTFLPESTTRAPLHIPHLVLATAQTLKPYHVPMPYSLVRVKVNGGAGSGAGPSFAASDLGVLDGTSDFPLCLNEVIPRLKKQETKRLGDPKPLIDQARAARVALPPTAPIGGERESTQQTLVDPTWLSRSERLRVEILFRFIEGEYRYGQGIESQPPDGIERPSPPRKGEGIRYGVEYGIEFGVVYEVSKGGEILSRGNVETQRFARVLEPPAQTAPSNALGSVSGLAAPVGGPD